MTIESTFVMIKPDALKRNLEDKIINRIKKKFIIVWESKVILDIKRLKEHYVEHEHKYFFSNLINEMTNETAILMRISGKNSINRIRKMIGATNVIEAKPGTIRGDYGDKNAPSYENLIHASDSKKSAKRELKLWFNYVHDEENCPICRQSDIIERINNAMKQKKGTKIYKTLKKTLDSIKEMFYTIDDLDYKANLAFCKWCNRRLFDGKTKGEVFNRIRK